MRPWKFVAAAIVLSVSAAIAQTPTPETTQDLAEAENQIDAALDRLEKKGRLEEALGQYQAVAAGLEGLKTDPQGPAHAERYRVLAYAYLRMGNVLRQLGRKEDALKAGEKELFCARSSGEDLTLARTYMNLGATLLSSGEADRGLDYIERSRPLFEAGEGFDFKQGLGWYWILKAELAMAGLTLAEPEDQLAALDTALEILLPIENWAGIARAYGLRSRVQESQGRDAAASADRKLQAEYQALDQGNKNE